MTKLRALPAVLIALSLGAGVVFAVVNADADSERAEVLRVVEESYIHGAFNEQNTDAMRDGFHPVFKIHGVRDGELSTYPIDEWTSNIDTRKAKPDYEQQTWKHRFPMVDITGGAAVVKVELLKVENGESTHVYTDYLSLLQFSDGWKITDKVYHRH